MICNTFKLRETPSIQLLRHSGNSVLAKTELGYSKNIEL